jgi:orotate phosphoribosyltransferase
MEGHFRLTSGRHSGQYVEKFRLLERPEVTERVGRELAARFRDEGVELVAGPAVGGILLAHETAKALGTQFVFAEREADRLTFRRGFSIEPEQRVLVVEDVSTTGDSAREVVDCVRAAGGQVVGVGLLVDRSGGTAQEKFDVRFEALLSLAMETFEPSDCPLCAQGVEVVKPGSRGV